MNSTTMVMPELLPAGLGPADGLPGYEQLFKSIFQCSAAGMLVLDLDGRCVCVNQAFCDLIGYTAEEVMARTVAEITHPDDVAVSQKMLRRLASGEAKFNQLEKRYVHKSGRPVWALLTAVLVPRSDGLPPLLAAGLVQDISQRKAAEEALQRSEALFRTIGENAGDLILIVDYPTMKALYVSPACRKLLGYSVDELQDRNSLELVHPDDLSVIHRATEEMVRKGSNGLIAEMRFRHKNGNWHHVEAHGCAVRDSRGELERIVVISRMIDDRILAQQALRRAHEEAELFIDSVPSILIGIRRDGRIKRWNLAAGQVFGLSAAEVTHRYLADCGIQWTRPDMKAEIASWCTHREPARIDALPFLVNGEARFLGLTLKWIGAREEPADELLIIGSDVTEREVLGQQLRQAQKLEAIGQLAAGIAHEINTPIQYVGDNTRFLQEFWVTVHSLCAITREMRQEARSGAISPQTLERFDVAAQAADFEYMQTEIPHAIEQSLEGIERVTRIVHAMKEFSHPGSEEKKSIDINRAIETTITVARNEWKYVSDVETHFDPELPLVLCHAGEFNQVVLNLLINAAQAIAEAVGDGSRGKGKIVISTARAQDWAEISIADTGAGIPEAIRSRVFEPFFTTKPVGKGTGQGLALAHTAIVRRHGGKIWFESEVGKGTTFFIRIPIADPAGG